MKKNKTKQTRNIFKKDIQRINYFNVYAFVIFSL